MNFLKENKLLHILGEVDEQFIMEAAPETKPRVRKKVQIIKYGSIVACLVCIVYGGIKDAPLLSKEDTNQIIQRLSQIGNEIALADYDAADPQDWEELKLALYDMLARLGELPYMGR